ncbi:hypothetical protein N9T21_01675 [Candidatus Pelagibacter sp.]|nr:hypothetical protein [Candidatus Pelagibacter sp.]
MTLITQNIKKNLTIIFLLFYFFMWYLPQEGGFTGIGQFSDSSSIIKNTLISKLTKIFMMIYNFVDYYIISLPKIIV